MLEGRGRILLLTLGFFFTFQLQSQEIKVNGGFLEDSLLIGKDVNFWVTATYPQDLEMIFPDTLADFSPFEFSGKQYFPSKLKEGLAYDSTVYSIQSFEIDLIQYFKMSAVILNGNDSIILDTPLDSIYFSELAPFTTDTTKLIRNTKYQAVNRQFNFPLLYYILGGLILIVIIVLLVFGRKMIKYFKLRRLRKEHEHFSETLSSYIKELKEQPDFSTAEKALILWKGYQEKLEKWPFSSLTTKEILALAFTNEIETPLRSIDRLVYGKRPTESIHQDFQQMEDFTMHRYSKKVEEIKNGK
ncbi:MAG: hypothetical protein AB8B73_13115 [Ekhidna sp.]